MKHDLYEFLLEQRQYYDTFEMHEALLAILFSFYAVFLHKLSGDLEHSTAKDR